VYQARTSIKATQQAKQIPTQKEKKKVSGHNKHKLGSPLSLPVTGKNNRPAQGIKHQVETYIATSQRISQTRNQGMPHTNKSNLHSQIN
jgi:hypothetical protein